LISGTTNGNFPIGNGAGATTRIYHNDGGAFTNFISLTNLFHSAVAWVDYDRDGRLDPIVSGLNGAGVPVTQLYHNNGNGIFTPVSADFPGVFSGTFAWGDYNNDGTPDLYMSGLVITSPSGATTNMAKLFRNNGDGTFTDTGLTWINAQNQIAGPNSGTATWGDFDNDGRMDLLLVGLINNKGWIGSVYRNLGNGAFTNVLNTSLSGGGGGFGAWIDFDNDGWPDAVICGVNTSVLHNNRNGTFTQVALLGGNTDDLFAPGDYNNDGYTDILISDNIWRNNNGGSFSALANSIPHIGFGAVAWGDYNNDGILDIFYSAGGTVIYLNNNVKTNTLPAAPANLAAAIGPTNSVLLTWSPVTDAQTTSNGVNYNLRVGTIPGGVDVISPLSDPVTGQRRVVGSGNASSTNRAMLINMPAGTYYWSVQAIDTAFAGSPFAAESSFTILPPPRAFPDAISTPVNVPVTFSASNLLTNDIDPNGLSLTVIAVPSNSAAGGAVSLGANTITYTPPSGFSGNDTFWYAISDNHSASASATITATVGQGGIVWLKTISGPALNNGDFVDRLAGVPGLTYTIEASSAASGPWVKIFNVTAPGSDTGFGIGGFEVREAIGSNTNRFYRWIYPSY